MDQVAEWTSAEGRQAAAGDQAGLPAAGGQQVAGPPAAGGQLAAAARPAPGPGSDCSRVQREFYRCRPPFRHCQHAAPTGPARAARLHVPQLRGA